MKRDAEKNNPLKLDKYNIVKVYMPNEPEVERYVWAWGKVIFINTGARPGANIRRLIK